MAPLKPAARFSRNAATPSSRILARDALRAPFQNELVAKPLVERRPRHATDQAKRLGGSGRQSGGKLDGGGHCLSIGHEAIDQTPFERLPSADRLGEQHRLHRANSSRGCGAEIGRAAIMNKTGARERKLQIIALSGDAEVDVLTG